VLVLGIIHNNMGRKECAQAYRRLVGEVQAGLTEEEIRETGFDMFTVEHTLCKMIRCK
jgi:hypothetical protein